MLDDYFNAFVPDVVDAAQRRMHGAGILHRIDGTVSWGQTVQTRYGPVVMDRRPHAGVALRCDACDAYRHMADGLLRGLSTVIRASLPSPSVLVCARPSPPSDAATQDCRWIEFDWDGLPVRLTGRLDPDLGGVVFTIDTLYGVAHA